MELIVFSYGCILQTNCFAVKVLDDAWMDDILGLVSSSCLIRFEYLLSFASYPGIQLLWTSLSYQLQNIQTIVFLPRGLLISLNMLFVDFFYTLNRWI